MTNFLEFPNKEQLDNAINKLKKIDLERISFQKICSILLKDIRLLPIDSMRIQKKTKIYRGRFNMGSLFTNESEISYNPNPESIKEFGRFNQPYQQRFYGLILLPENEKESIIKSIYAEIKNDNVFKNEVSLLAIGCWEVIEDFEITTTLFEDSNTKLLKSQYPEKIYEIERVIDFYSEQIKKPVSKINHNRHKLTAAYSNYIFTHVNRCFGIVYHSVETALKGRNVVLLPEAVDSFLELKEIRLYLVMEKEDSQLVYKEIMKADELGELNTSFRWKYSINSLNQ